MVLDVLPDFSSVLQVNALGFGFQELNIFLCVLADVRYDFCDEFMQCGLLIQNEDLAE